MVFLQLLSVFAARVRIPERAIAIQPFANAWTQVDVNLGILACVSRIRANNQKPAD